MRKELLIWLEAFLSAIPGQVGLSIRSAWYPRRCAGPGRCRVGRGVEVVAPGSIHLDGGEVRLGDRCYVNAEGGSITLGDQVAFNIGCHINASVGGRISVGANSMFGPSVLMRTANHRFDSTDEPMREQGHAEADIIIEEDVWVGGHAVVLGGVRIGRGSVVGAGAVVTKSLDPWSVAVGVPARVIRTRRPTGSDRAGR